MWSAVLVEVRRLKQYYLQSHTLLATVNSITMAVVKAKLSPSVTEKSTRRNWYAPALIDINSHANQVPGYYLGEAATIELQN